LLVASSPKIRSIASSISKNWKSNPKGKKRHIDESASKSESSSRPLVSLRDMSNHSELVTCPRHC
jgi:hypothetical protein